MPTTMARLTIAAPIRRERVQKRDTSTTGDDAVAAIASLRARAPVTFTRERCPCTTTLTA